MKEKTHFASLLIYFLHHKSLICFSAAHTIFIAFSVWPCNLYKLDI